MLIYKLLNKTNGKIYIGQTISSLAHRLGQHFSNKKSLISRALKKHGTDLFEISVIEMCESKEQLNEKEIYWITFFDCRFPKGYNLAFGGESTAGYKHTEESKRKMSKAAKGKKLSEETRKKMSLCKLGIPVKTKSMLGKHHTEEAKEKNRIAHIGRKANQETRSKMSEERKKRWASPEYIEKMRQMHSTRIYTKDERRRRSEGARLNWEVRKVNAC